MSEKRIEELEEEISGLKTELSELEAVRDYWERGEGMRRNEANAKLAAEALVLREQLADLKEQVKDLTTLAKRHESIVIDLDQRTTNVANRLMDDIRERYHERSKIILALMRCAQLLGWPCGIARDARGEVGFQNYVAIELPTGQVTWHVHDKDLDLFIDAGMGAYDKAWDGHTTAQKNDRLVAFGKGA